MGVAARWMDRDTRNGYSQYQVNYRHEMEGTTQNLIRDEIRITGIQIFLLLNGDEYGIDSYDLLLAI